MNAEDVDTKVTFMCELIESAENVKASGLVTLSVFENVKSVTRYYKLQDSSLEAPLKPTVDTISEWSTTEPPYEYSKLLYYCDITTLSTGEWIPSEVSVSGIYQSLQSAYDKIDKNDELIQSWCSENDQTKINGGSIYMDKAFAESIFAKDITAKGTITGATLYGAYIETIGGKIGPFTMSSSGLKASSVTTAGIYLPYKIGLYEGYIQIGAYPDEYNWDDPIVINGYEAGWCVMRHDGVRVGGSGKYNIASSYQEDCLIAGELWVENGAIIKNGAVIENGAVIKLGATIHGGVGINGGAYVSGEITADTASISGTLTAHNVDIGIYALLGGPGSVTIVDPNADKNGEVYFGVNKADSASSSTSYVRGRKVRIYSHDKGGVYLGSSGSTAITSDEKLKNIFEIDDKYELFFNNIEPVAYKYKVGHRTHLGFGARAIENALQDANLTTEEFAGILIDRDVSVGEDEIMSPDGATHFDEIYSLRYEEFIALNTYMIKKQQGIIEDLTHRIESIENTLIETKGK